LNCFLFLFSLPIVTGPVTTEARQSRDPVSSVNGEHLQQIVKTLAILKKLVKEPKNLLQQFGIPTCQIVSLAKFLIRACRYPPRGCACHRAIPRLRFSSRTPGESSGPYSRRPRAIFFFIAPYAELLPVLSPAGIDRKVSVASEPAATDSDLIKSRWDNK